LAVRLEGAQSGRHALGEVSGERGDTLPSVRSLTRKPNKNGEPAGATRCDFP
jgi:hypothetical protein